MVEKAGLEFILKFCYRVGAKLVEKDAPHTIPLRPHFRIPFPSEVFSLIRPLAITVGITSALAVFAASGAAQASQNAQAPPPPNGNTQPRGAQTAPPPDEPLHRGGFVPGQKRKAEDPQQVSRGKLLFGINCRGCHGADLRGGDLGGPNLLRSQVALSDLDGELIIPIIHGSRQSMGMPAIPLNDADAAAAAAYVRSVIETIQGQGAPPSEKEPPSILIGNAAEGKDYFATKCGVCHSATGDLANFASRFKDDKKLQDSWLAGGTEEQFREPSGANSSRRTVTATITLPSGETVQGNLLRVDDFMITVSLADGTQRTFSKNTAGLHVAVNDPLKVHRDMLPQYTDKEIHDVTAYLATLK